MLTDYWRNKIMDANLRGQAIVFPATRYLALFSSMPTTAGGGTEIANADFDRIAVAASLANWSGTQGAGTTGVSNGSTGRMSNNVDVEFVDPCTVAVPAARGVGMFDAAVAGNLLEFGYIVDADGNPIIRSFSIGDPIVFTPGTLVFTLA